MAYPRSTGSLVEATSNHTSGSGHSALGDDNGDILLNLAIKDGAEMTERAKSLYSQGADFVKNSQGAAQKIQRSIIAANGEGISGQQLIAELRAALTDKTPVNSVALAQDKAFLGNYIAAASVLGAFGTGTLLGKYVCSIVLRAFLTGPAAVALSFVVVPAAYFYHLKTIQLRSPNHARKEIRNLDYATGAILGCLNGFLLSGYPSLTALPICLMPFYQAATVHFVGPLLLGGSNPVERSAYVGTVSSVWIAPFVGAEIVTVGSIGVGSMYSLATGCVASAGVLQIAIACRQGRCKSIGNLSSICILLSVCAAESILTTALQQTYEQIQKSSQLME